MYLKVPQYHITKLGSLDLSLHIHKPPIEILFLLPFNYLFHYSILNLLQLFCLPLRL